MKRAKKKKDRRERYLVSAKQMDKIRSDMSKQGVTLSSLIIIAHLASKFGWSEEEIVEFYLDVSRFTEFAYEGSLSPDDIQEIIERHTGMKMPWDWKKFDY